MCGEKSLHPREETTESSTLAGFLEERQTEVLVPREGEFVQELASCISILHTGPVVPKLMTGTWLLTKVDRDVPRFAAVTNGELRIINTIGWTGC